MADTRNIRSHLNPVRQSHASNLTQRGVWFFRRGRIDARANTPFLRATLQRRRRILGSLLFPAFPNELSNRWHNKKFITWAKALLITNKLTLVKIMLSPLQKILRRLLQVLQFQSQAWRIWPIRFPQESI